MSRSFPVTFICRCRKKWYGGQICTAGKTGRKGFTAVKYALSSIVYCPKCGEIYRRNCVEQQRKALHSVAVLHPRGTRTGRM